MKGNVIILFLSLIILEFACAAPSVNINSRAQALRRDQKTGRALHKASLRDDISDDDEDGIEKLNADGEGKYVARPLTAGDIFTARELLPVAEKLFEKIENPGEGKGIVSSATQPEELADKLFKDFFMTSSRIVTLTDGDITGLDALQSLALAGEPATRTNFVDQTKPKKKKKVVDFNGQFVEIDDQTGNTSRLKVLTKQTLVRVPKSNKTKRVGPHRRENKLIKRMGRNRHLVVQRKSMKSKRRQVKSAPPCRWSYECKDPTDLDSCRLKTKCNNLRKPDDKVDHNQSTFMRKAIGRRHSIPKYPRERNRGAQMGSNNYKPKKDINSKVNVDPKIITKFRKALAITALDEEVEKIIENRVLKHKPKNMESAEKIESLSEYFRNILLLEGKGATPTRPEYDYYNGDPIEQKSTEKQMMLKADDADGNVQKLKAEGDERKLKRQRQKYKYPKV